MIAKTPSNIFFPQYTTGGEYLIKNTYAPYQGYYYMLGNKVYAGQEYDINNPEIIRIGEANSLIYNTDSNVSTYGFITQKDISQTSVFSTPFSPTDEDLSNGYVMRYFIKKVNDNNIIETDKESFNTSKGDPLYQTEEVKFVFVDNEQIIEDANKRMPGLGDILNEYVLPGGDGEADEDIPKPKNDSCGFVAVAPNTGSIGDDEVFIIDFPSGIRVNKDEPDPIIYKIAVFEGVDNTFSKDGSWQPKDFPINAAIAKPLRAMLNAAKRDGVYVTVMSGIRSPEDRIFSPTGKNPIPGRENIPFAAQSQRELYNNYLAGKSKDKVAPPNTSNHGRSKAFDLNAHVERDGRGGLKARSRDKQALSVIGDELAAYKWLVANAWQYGFVRTVPSEGHHWEYRPGSCQFAFVSKSNYLYTGLGKEFMDNLKPSPPWSGPAKKEEKSLPPTNNLLPPWQRIPLGDIYSRSEASRINKIPFRNNRILPTPKSPPPK